MRRVARPGHGRGGVRVRDRGTGRPAPTLEELRAHLVEQGLARFKLPVAPRGPARAAAHRERQGAEGAAARRAATSRSAPMTAEADFRAWVRVGAVGAARAAAGRPAGRRCSAPATTISTPAARYLAGARGHGPRGAVVAARVRRARRDAGRGRRSSAASSPTSTCPTSTPISSGSSWSARRCSRTARAEQCARWLPPIATGDEIWCQLFSEPGAGSDLAGLSTRAHADGDEWRVHGQKVWTSRGAYSRYGLLLARHDPVGAEAPGHHRVRDRPAHARASTCGRCAR